MTARIRVAWAQPQAGARGHRARGRAVRQLRARGTRRGPAGSRRRRAAGAQARQADGRVRRRLLLGSPGRVPARQGRRRGDVGICRRLGRHREVRAGQRRGHWPRRIGAGDIRSRVRSRSASCCACSSRSPTIRPSSIARGPTRGTQYRSAVFFTDAEQKRITDAYVAQLDRRQAAARPHRHRGRPAAGLLPGRALPPELRDPASRTIRTSSSTTRPRSRISASCSPSFTARADGR